MNFVSFTKFHIFPPPNGRTGFGGVTGDARAWNHEGIDAIGAANIPCICASAGEPRFSGSDSVGGVGDPR